MSFLAKVWFFLAFRRVGGIFLMGFGVFNLLDRVFVVSDTSF